jgi:hypothetical protein
MRFLTFSSNLTIGIRKTFAVCKADSATHSCSPARFMAPFNWPELPLDIAEDVAKYFLFQANVVYLGAYFPVPSSDLAVWDFIHEYRELLGPALNFLYRGRLVVVRNGELGNDTLSRRQEHLKWIRYLRVNLRCFAELVVMRSGSSLCHYPVDEFHRLRVLALDIWPSDSVYDLLAERTVSQHASNDGPRIERPKVRILITVSDLSHREEPDETLARKLSMAFDTARQQYSSALVRVPPKLKEIRIKIDLLPLEFNALQSQNFHEPGVGDWSFVTTSLAGPGEFMLVWTLQSVAQSTAAPKQSGIESSTNSEAEPLSVDEWLNMSDLLS